MLFLNNELVPICILSALPTKNFEKVKLLPITRKGIKIARHSGITLSEIMKNTFGLKQLS